MPHHPPTGTVQIDYRIIDPQTDLPTPWQMFTFYLTPLPQLYVSDLSLANDTGVSNTDRITTDPTLNGGVDVLTTVPAWNVSDFTGATIALDFDGDNAADAYTTVIGDGTFTYYPEALTTGNRTVKAWVLEWDFTSGNTYQSDPHSCPSSSMRSPRLSSQPLDS